MMHRGLLAIGIIGLCLGWCGNLLAEDKTPDEIMKAKGLAKVGSFYLLEDDARLSDWLRLTRSTQKTLDDNLKKRAEIDKGIKLADSSMAKWDSDVRQLQEKQQKVKKGSTFEYNDIGAQINTLLGKIREASRFKADREAVLKKLGDPRDDYIGMVLELSEKMEAAAKKYEALAKDPEVKEALTRMNEKGMPRMKLGPSAQFTQELPFIRGQRKTITSAAIKLNIEDGVPHVQATINGKLSRSLVVDSGAAVVTLTWDLAQELGLKPGAKDQPIELRTADGKKINARLMVLESVRVGQFTAENVQCAVLPKSMPGDNLLGGTFLRNFVYRMDLGAGELHLSEIVVPQAAQTDAKPVAASPPVVAANGPDKNPAPATQAARNIFDFDDTDLAPATRPAVPPKPPIAISVPSPATRPSATMPSTAPGVLARLPVPPAEERQKAGKLVEEVFAAEMTDAGPAARRTLADHLLSEAGKTPDPPVDQFVLLIGALRAAEDARDLTLCFRVIDALASRFDVDALRLRTRSAGRPRSWLTPPRKRLPIARPGWRCWTN
jgi:clan AA aspartic protease (TIGR02281 family)